MGLEEQGTVQAAPAPRAEGKVCCKAQEENGGVAPEKLDRGRETPLGGEKEKLQIKVEIPTHMAQRAFQEQGPVLPEATCMAGSAGSPTFCRKAPPPYECFLWGVNGDWVSFLAQQSGQLRP